MSIIERLWLSDIAPPVLERLKNNKKVLSDQATIVCEDCGRHDCVCLTEEQYDASKLDSRSKT